MPARRTLDYNSFLKTWCGPFEISVCILLFVCFFLGPVKKKHVNHDAGNAELRPWAVQLR